MPDTTHTSEGQARNLLYAVVAATLPLLAGCRRCDGPPTLRDVTGLEADRFDRFAELLDDLLDYVGPERVCAAHVTLANLPDDEFVLRPNDILVDPDALPGESVAAGVCAALDRDEGLAAEAPDLFDGSDEFVARCAAGPFPVGYFPEVDAACGTDRDNARRRFFADRVFPHFPEPPNDGSLQTEVRASFSAPHVAARAGHGVALGDRLLVLTAAQGPVPSVAYAVDLATGEEEPLFSLAAGEEGAIFGGREAAAVMTARGGSIRLSRVDAATGVRTPVSIDSELTGSPDAWVGIVDGGVLHLALHGLDFPLEAVDLTTGTVTEIPLPEKDSSLGRWPVSVGADGGGVVVNFVEAGVDDIGQPVIGRNLIYRYAVGTWTLLSDRFQVGTFGLTDGGLLLGVAAPWWGSALAAWDLEAQGAFVSGDLCYEDDRTIAVVGDELVYATDDGFSTYGLAIEPAGDSAE